MVLMMCLGVQTVDIEGQEWDEGRTVSSKHKCLETGRSSMTLVDTPGAADLHLATLRGLAEADAVLVVVNGKTGVLPPSFARPPSPEALLQQLPQLLCVLHIATLCSNVTA
jgi:translation elongation factor EF-1alpha